MASKLWCCVPNCNTTQQDGITLHVFPNPDKEPDRFQSWRDAIGGDILALDNQYIYKQRRVCHKHFETKYCTWRARIVGTAVPSLYLTVLGTKRILRDTQNERPPQPCTSSTEEIKPSLPPCALAIMDVVMEKFKGAIDRYNGVTVDSRDEACDPELFSCKLNDSLSKWKSENKRCIWFKVHIQDAAWVPILANVGFDFHHARDSFVMMYKWLPEENSANLPPACHTNLGVGGIVLNENNQLLVVTEQHTEVEHWKLPGGYVERGEDIKDAAVREVKEETGIDAVFDSMVTFRHTHNAMFGNSDIYAVVLLKATSEAIDKSDIEIAACKWMDVQEFLKHPNVIEFNRFIVQQALDLRNRRVKLDLEKTVFSYAKFTKFTSLVLKDL